MERNSNIQRMRALPVEGIRIGVISVLLSSIIYSVLIIGGLIVTIVIGPPDSGLDKGSMILAILFFIGIYAIIAGIFPSLIIGILGGACIGLFLSLWREKLNSVLAGFIGFLVGLILVSIADYLSWTYSIQNTSFFEFLLLNKVDRLIPSILSLPISFYMGWKTNNMNTTELA